MLKRMVLRLHQDVEAENSFEQGEYACDTRSTAEAGSRKRIAT
jgi:hypothetical protein